MSDDQHKNIIDFSEARKKQRPTRRLSPPGWGSPKKKPGKGNGKGRDVLANFVRWIQFLAFLALTAYILQQCGML